MEHFCSLESLKGKRAFGSRQAAQTVEPMGAKACTTKQVSSFTQKTIDGVLL